jgi:hypothetical protein
MKSTTVVLQAYEAPDTPTWIARCLDSVRRWSIERGHDYELLSDGFFARSPVWFRERCGNQGGPVTDLSRVLLMQDLFGRGYQKVIWVDADVLVFDSTALEVNIGSGFLALYEITLGIGPNGEVNVSGPTVNGAVLAATSGSVVFDFYRHAIEENVRNFRGQEIPRTIAGPEMLTRIAQVVPIECLTTVGLFTPAMLGEIARGEDRLARIFAERFGYRVAAANLCHFFRGEISADARARFDSLMLTAIERLLETRGDCVNRYLPGLPAAR